MGWLRLLLSPGGVGGTRESVKMALRTNLGRAQGSPFEARTTAIATTLANRYRVVRRPFNPAALVFEAAPFAFAPEARAIELVSEYIVDQEHPDKVEPWFGPTMHDLLAQFFSVRSVEYASAFRGMFVGLFGNQMDDVHWLRWLDEEILGMIYDRAKEAGLDEYLDHVQRWRWDASTP